MRLWPGSLHTILTCPIHATFFLVEITLKVSDQIVAQAKARGLTVEEYIEEVLARQAGTGSPEARRPLAPGEIREWLDSLAQFSDKIPPLPETITREWIYQEHD